MWKIVTMMAIAQTQTPVLPEWMAGCWEQRSGQRTTVECWSLPEGDVMTGESISRRSGQVVEQEAMQIHLTRRADPGLTFRAIPKGSQPTEFRWVPGTETDLTFINAEHDYPQRIRYWREGKYLMAEIALADGSKARRWRYSRMGN